jgi:tetratricopeptide (TPR) repeat protein
MAPPGIISHSAAGHGWVARRPAPRACAKLVRAVAQSRRSPTTALQRLLLVAVLLVVAVLLDARVPASEPQAEGFAAAPAPAGTSTPAPLSAAAIDALVFSNRYEKASQAYARLVAAAPDDPAAHTSYALFLAYTGDLAHAVDEARRGVALAPDEGRAHAVLCRTLDWDGQVLPAVVEGGIAVAKAEDDPLAHLFFSEALADRGVFDQARAEIQAANALITAATPVYVQAEAHREAANLANDQGQRLVRIDALASAEKLQPDWVERVAELATALFDDGDVDRAHGEFDRALALRGDDAGMLLNLGSEAMVAGDYDDARTAFTRAAQLAPDSVAAQEGLAQVAMGRDGDADSAAGHLQAALSRDPGDEAAAAYLLWLARDVWGDQARGRALIAEATAGTDDLRPGHLRTPPDPDAVLRSHQQRALAAVNKLREQAGLPPVRLDDRLDAAAAAHSYYWLFNQARPSQKGLGIHTETPGTPGFSGVTVYERGNAFGWHDGPMGEDITHRGAPELAVSDWVDSVYHRFPILRPDLRVIGYADASLAGLPIEDMEFGFSPGAGNPKPVVYPADGQSDVPATFDDNELPDPVPAGGPRVTGYPVTVTFPRYSDVRLLSFTLSGPSGPIAYTFTLPPTDATENSASLLPGAPLQPGARYTAHIDATVDGASYDRTWSFTVGV